MQRSLSFAAAISFLACTQALAQQLTAADFQKAVKNKNVSLSCADGTNGSGKYTMPGRSGIIKGSYMRPGVAAMADVGQVSAQGESLCIKFKMLNGGDEKCFGVSQTGASTYKLSTAGFTACTIAAR